MLCTATLMLALNTLPMGYFADERVTPLYLYATFLYGIGG